MGVEISAIKGGGNKVFVVYNATDKTNAYHIEEAIQTQLESLGVLCDTLSEPKDYIDLQDIESIVCSMMNITPDMTTLPKSVKRSSSYCGEVLRSGNTRKLLDERTNG